MKQINLLQRFPDGSFIDWGRNAKVDGLQGEGGALAYRGEAAEVMALVLKYQDTDQSSVQHSSTKEG